MRLLRRRTRKALRNEYEDVAHGFALGVPVIIGIIVFVLALAAGGIWLATASSAVRGSAAMTRQHNSGSNQVAQNTTLLNASAVVISDEQKIKTLAANVVTEQDRMDLAGLEQNCATDVQAYNAAVRGILAAGYLPSSLPSSYPVTACNAPTSNSAP